LQKIVKLECTVFELEQMLQFMPPWFNQKYCHPDRRVITWYEYMETGAVLTGLQAVALMH